MIGGRKKRGDSIPLVDYARSNALGSREISEVLCVTVVNGMQLSSEVGYAHKSGGDG